MRTARFERSSTENPSAPCGPTRQACPTAAVFTPPAGVAVRSLAAFRVESGWLDLRNERHERLSELRADPSTERGWRHDADDGGRRQRQPGCVRWPDGDGIAVRAAS